MQHIKNNLVAASQAFNALYDKPYTSPSDIWNASEKLSEARKEAVHCLAYRMDGEDLDTWLIQAEEEGRKLAIMEAMT